MSAPRSAPSERRRAGPYGGKGLTALQTAQACVQLGACKRTIELMTGLPATFILRFVFDKANGARRGRPAYSDEFIGRAPLRVQAAASAVAARYERLRQSGFAPAESLITAYRHYLTFPDAPRLLFDEAFYLCCNLDGIWACRARALQLADCTGCGSRHLQAYGSGATSCCAFCNGRRADTQGDARMTRESDRQRTAPRLDARVTALRIRRTLKELGASDRIADVLMSGMAGIEPAFRPPPPSQLVHWGPPLPLQRWGTSLSPRRRVQYSAVVTVYASLREAGFSPEESVVAAFRHLKATFREESPLTLDRCVEVVSLASACWGVACAELLRRTCPACGAEHLFSRQDTAPPACPFCLLLPHQPAVQGRPNARANPAAGRHRSAFPVACNR